jgi:hypothetical protein
MNTAQLKCLAVFSIFAVIGFGPISPGCLLGMFIVLNRPLWFLQLIEHLYAGKQLPKWVMNLDAKQIQQARKKCFFSLLTLFIVDILPVPVTPVIAFVIILSRPVWFYQLVRSIYADSAIR